MEEVVNNMRGCNALAHIQGWLVRETLGGET
jgi:hypothetical protein